MLALLKDARQRPELFAWFGSIPKPEIEGWLLRSELVFPQDLVELWQATGGGDVFESETIFRPPVPSIPGRNFVADDIESINLGHRAKGKSSELYIFHQGVFLSAVRLVDQTFVTLSESYVVDRTFHSLDDWYILILRAEFAKRYGLDRW